MVLENQQQQKLHWEYKKIDGKVKTYTDKIGYVPQKINDWTLPIRGSDFMTLTEE